MTVYQKFHDLMLDSVSYFIEECQMKDPIKLCLSGGMDSSIIMFALHELGHDVEPWVFQLGNDVNRDVLCAEKMTKSLGFSLKKTTCEQAYFVLIRDVVSLLDNLKTNRATTIQCAHPFIYLSESISPGWCFVGLHADSMYGSSREANFTYHKFGNEGYREYRKKASNLDNYSNSWDINYLGVKKGVNYVDPYRNEELIEFVVGLDKEQIWKGRIKVLPYKAFIDYFKRGAWVREPEPMQIVTGIREWHSTLLNTPYNIKGWKRIDKVYLEIAKANNIDLNEPIDDLEEK